MLVKSLKNTLRYSYPTSITNNVNSPREFYYISCAQAFNERENRLLLVQLKTNFQAAAFKRPSERDVERKESINKARLWQNKITKAVESSTEFVVELMHTPAASAAG